MRKILTLKQVCAYIPYSKPYIYELIKNGKFPRQRKLRPEGRAVGWCADAIEAFQKGEWKPLVSRTNEKGADAFLMPTMIPPKAELAKLLR
jgi:predicted DNA-binding transcriptional regulator AlpA